MNSFVKWKKQVIEDIKLLIQHSLHLKNLYTWILSTWSGFKCVVVSCGYDTWFAVRLVMDYTASLDYTQKWTKSTLAVKLSVSAIITPGGLPQSVYFLLMLTLVGHLPFGVVYKLLPRLFDKIEMILG